MKESLAVIIPTVKGREEVLTKAITSLRHAPISAVYVVRGRETCGEAWNIGISHALYEGATYVLLFADDLYAADRGWWKAGRDCLKRGEIPACILLNEDGNRWNVGDGNPGQPYAFPRIPMLTLRMARDIFPIPNIHYYSDCWIGTKASSLGIKCRVTEGFTFFHSWSNVARKTDADNERDRQLYETEAGRL